MRERGRILILGLPYFGRMLAGQLAGRRWEATYAAHPGRSLGGWLKLARAVARADIVYLIGSRLDRRSPQDWLMQVRRKPVVIHWVGTDVPIAAAEHERGNSSRRLVERAIHWCDAPWLADELAGIGIHADYVGLPVPLETAAPPALPARFRALLYLPVDSFDREVFDTDTLLALPREFPEVDFTLIPSPPETLPAPLPPNLEARGWVQDMDALYAETTAYVRLTSHDGMSFMALEALSRGRYVIWTHPLQGAIEVHDRDEVVAALRGLIVRHQRGELPLNEAGRTATLARFGSSQQIGEIERRLEEMVG